MGKGTTNRETVDQTQTANSRFNSNAFLQQLQEQLEEFQQQQRQQSTQSQTGIQRQQQATGLDAGSQAFVDQLRNQALTGVGQIGAANFAPDLGQIQSLQQQLSNPFQNQVIGQLGRQFDNLRNQATRGVSQAATSAGAFGGSRQGVAEAARLSSLDRQQTDAVGQLLSNNFNQSFQQAQGLANQQAQAPLQALLAQQGFLRGGLGPTGQVSTGVQQSQTQAIQDLINALSGSSSATNRSTQTQRESGRETARGTLSGQTTNRESGGLFGDILGTFIAAGGLPILVDDDDDS